MTKQAFLPRLLLIPILAVFLLLTSFSDGNKGSVRDNTPGIVTFTVKTVTENGTYSPKNILAIWVEKDGVFVKTRKAMANQRKQYLYTWRASSNYNVIDAITGPTLTSHQTHTVEWDCTDVNGDVVPDGEYTMRIEYTDKHAQGPLYSISFMKGTEPVTINPANQPYFINMQLTYEPDVTAIAEFGADITQACPQQNITFTDNSTAATSWEWNFGSGAVPQTANTQGPHIVYYTTPGAKTVTLTINGSVSVTKTDYITIFPEPVSGFTFNIVSRTVTFTNTSQNAVSYSWDFGDGNTSTESSPVHVYAEDGEFEVSLTATSEMCGSDVHTELIVINTVRIPETENEFIEVYPNPSSGKFYFSVKEQMNDVKIRLYDVQGRLVYSQEASDVDAGFVFSSDERSFKPGLYFLDFASKNAVLRKKLMVQ